MRVSVVEDGEREFREAIARERIDRRHGAKAFAAACAAGDVEVFAGAVDFLDERVVDGWRLAMMQVARLPAVSAEIRAAFLGVWIESKMLPLRIGDRRVLANALRVLLPCDYRGEPMRLYRGANWPERCHRRYGFSWTRDRAMAQRFAQPHAGIFEGDDVVIGARAREIARQWGGGVVLETLVPAEAVLLVREVEGYYDEGEIVVDPFKLGPVAVAERIRG